MRTSTVRTLLGRLSVNDELAALIAVVSRDAVSPPDLTGDAPVLNVLQPMQVDLVKTLRYKFQFPGLKRVDRRLRQLLHLHEPLLLDQRLHCRTAAIMSTDRVAVRLHLHKIPLLLEIRHDGFSRLVALHACVLAALFIDGGVVVHDVDLRQVMALAHLEVVRVMRRRDLHRACTELFIYIVIRHDGDLSVYQRQDHIFPNDVLVSLIIRVYRDGSIAQHRLRTCGRDLKETVCPHDGILDMPEVSVLILVLHLGVRQGCLTLRAPVDDAGAFINVSLLI